MIAAQETLIIIINVEIVLLNIFVAFFQESSESSKEQDLFDFLIKINLFKKYPPTNFWMVVYM